MAVEMAVEIVMASIVKRHVVGMAMLRDVISCSRSQPSPRIRDYLTNILDGDHWELLSNGEGIVERNLMGLAEDIVR